MGFPFGALPAGGAETPTFLSYVLERRLARRSGSSEEFGHGAIEGVAGPEAANNASAAGMFVPLLAMGLPVTATAAILLAAMRVYGIVPGTDPDGGPGRPGLDPAGQPADRQHAAAADQPAARAAVGTAAADSLVPSSTPASSSSPRSGAYAVNQDAFDVALLLVFGAIGFAVRRFAIPILPLILGVIIGPLMEERMRQALDLSDGNVSGLVDEPLAVGIYVLIVLALVVPPVLGRLRRPRAEGGAQPVEEGPGPSPHDDEHTPTSG